MIRKFSIKVPESKRSLFFADKSYFIKLPETVFSFDIFHVSDEVKAHMKCNYFKQDKLYFCLFPNQDTFGNICLNEKNHYIMKTSASNYSEKAFVKNAIDLFYKSRFSVTTDVSCDYMMPYGTYHHEINSQCKSINDIYAYWQKRSADKSFCILENDAVKSKPLSNWFLGNFLSDYFPSVAKIPYLKDYLEE